MQTKTSPRNPVENWESIRDEWVESVEHLASEAEAWASRRKWLVHRDRKTLTEGSIGSYDVPMLVIHCPNGRLILDPVARYISGASGRIDLSVFPSYDTVLIIRTDAGWRLKRIDPPEFERPWSEGDFVEVASELATHS